MEDQTVSHIQNLKTSTFDKLYFNPDGQKLAVIVTEEDEDKVEIYKTDNWKISRVSRKLCRINFKISDICTIFLHKIVYNFIQE